MSDYTFEVLRQQAESLELTGVDAARYIQEQQIAYRDERAKERELEKIRIEAERIMILKWLKLIVVLVFEQVQIYLVVPHCLSSGMEKILRLIL